MFPYHSSRCCFKYYITNKNKNYRKSIKVGLSFQRIQLWRVKAEELEVETMEVEGEEVERVEVE